MFRLDIHKCDTDGLVSGVLTCYTWGIDACKQCDIDDDACDPRPAPRPCRGRVRWAGRVAAAKCRHYHAKHTAAAIKIPRPGDTPLKRNIL